MNPVSQSRAETSRQTLIASLRASNNLRAAVLAVVLARCHERTRCRSASCPVCGLAFQQAAVSVVDRFIREPARALRNRMTAITIIPASGCVGPDELTVEAFQRSGDDIQATLAAFDLPPSITGIEVSFNEDLTGEAEPHWCIHGHTVQVDWLANDQEEQLHAAFPRSDKIKKPVQCEYFDGDIQGRRYPFKPERFRRVTDLNTDHPARRPYRDTKHRPLRADQAVSLALVEHRVGFVGRLRLHDIDEVAARRHLEGLGWPRDGP